MSLRKGKEKSYFMCYKQQIQERLRILQCAQKQYTSKQLQPNELSFRKIRRSWLQSSQKMMRAVIL